MRHLCITRLRKNSGPDYTLIPMKLIIISPYTDARLPGPPRLLLTGGLRRQDIRLQEVRVNYY